MLTRKQRTFRSTKQPQKFVSLSIVENGDGEYLLLRREAESFRELFSVRPQAAAPIDLFGELSSALRIFECRCFELQRRGWQIARAA